MSAARAPDASKPGDRLIERAAERLPFMARVRYRRGGFRAEVEVVDVSVLGARVRSLDILRTGDPIWLAFPGLEPLEAIVAWADKFTCGCRFVRPMHPAVLDAMLARRKKDLGW